MFDYILISFGIILILILMLRKRRRYWQHHKVTTIETLPVVGHFGKCIFLNGSLIDTCSDLYANSKGNAFIGVQILHKPALFIRDPNLALRILLEDGSFFGDG